MAQDEWLVRAAVGALVGGRRLAHDAGGFGNNKGGGMDVRLARILIVGLAVSGGAIISATPGHAQFAAGGDGPTNIKNSVKKNLNGAQPQAKPDTQPAVLPGTKGPSDPAEPTSAVRDLTPTDALFDAINRGDLTAARDAVNRGADLDGRNVLGLTPLDLSVDLGRNDISFALLSMRREYASPAPRGPAGAAQRSAEAAPHAAARVRLVRASSGPADEAEPERPRYVPGNGGTPIPAAGFLGFDEARAAR
jgi:hypothetical protein